MSAVLRHTFYTVLFCKAFMTVDFYVDFFFYYAYLYTCTPLVNVVVSGLNYEL